MKNYKNFSLKCLFTQYIILKNQSKRQLQQSITDHAKQFQKIYNSPIKNALKHEINAYLQNEKQKHINNELKKLRLGKLVNNSIS